MSATPDFERVNDAALAQYPRLLETWLPGGRLNGREYIAADLNGGRGRSLSVNVATGVWRDFAADVQGGDPVSLYAAIHGLGQGEAARRLVEDLGLGNGNGPRPSGRSRSPKPDPWTPLLPVPDDAPPPNKQHFRLGAPSAVWTYQDGSGAVLGYAYRFDAAEGKEVLPLVFCTGPDGRREWRWKAFSEPRPIYGLDRLAGAKAGAPVLLVEGEKAADAADRVVPGAVAMTWPGGCKAVGKADFTPLAGRRVVVWPDADAPGIKAALDIADILARVGVAEFKILEPPADVPEGWDLADAEAEGWAGPQVVEHIKKHSLSPNAFRERVATRFGIEPQRGLAGGDAQGDDWTPQGQKWPVLSPVALPGIVGEFVSLATRRSEADPAAVLATFLTRFGAELCGFAPKSGPYMQISDGWHRPRLFTAIVGDSSKARKGTSAQPVKRLFTVDDGGHVPATTSPGPLSSGEGLIYAVRDEVKTWQAGKKKGDEACWVVSDPGVTDKRLFVLDEELAAALHSTARKGNILSTVLRGLWDRGDAAPLTKASPTRTTGAHVCVVSHITVSELKALLDQVQAFNGFANRFLWVCARRQKLVPFPEPMPAAELTGIRCEIVRLVKLAQGRGNILLDNTARDLWEAVYPELSKSHPGLSGCVINRGEAQCLRLSMLYALLDGQDRVQAPHLEAALSFWAYCRDSALAIFGEHEADPVVEKILAALKSGAKSMTELHQSFGNNASSGRIKSTLEELTRDGRVCVDRVPTATKPKNLFRLNEKYELNELSPGTQGENSYSSFNSYQDEKKMALAGGVHDNGQSLPEPSGHVLEEVPSPQLPLGPQGEDVTWV